MTVELLAKATAQFFHELKRNKIRHRDALVLAGEFVRQNVMNEELGKMGPSKDPWEET